MRDNHEKKGSDSMVIRWVLHSMISVVLLANGFTQTEPSALNTQDQKQNVAKLTIRAIVIDRDLNVKPVPKFVLSLQPVSVLLVSATMRLSTGIDGAAEAQVPIATYRVRSEKPLTFEGRQYSWDVEAIVRAPNTTIELSNDNAKISEGPSSSVDDLTSVFKKHRNAVVTVWAEVGAGHGTGFIADSSGLVLTNQHVVTTSQYIAVEFDEKRILPATLLAVDPTKDVAVLWVDFSRVPEAHPAPLLKNGDVPAEEGEKVFTIGSPLHQSKVMTTGIVSKVEARAIISDININHGNSGGPLFNSLGTVIGITTFGDISRSGGPGISGIIRIEQALPLLDEARLKMGSVQKPSPEFLPAFPSDTYPLEAIKESAKIEKFKSDPYIFGIGDYDVALITPILRYRGLASDFRAAKEKEKRNRKNANAVQGTFQPLDNLKGWAEYVGAYEPVLLIQASPRMKESFLSAFSRGMASSHGYVSGPAKLHFKTDFYKMKLFCGAQEVRPLFPGKIERVADEHNAVVNITDATFDGLYKYPADAIQNACENVSIQLFSEKDPDKPKIKVLDKKTIAAISADFAPYMALHSGLAKPDHTIAVTPQNANRTVPQQIATSTSTPKKDDVSNGSHLRPRALSSTEATASSPEPEGIASVTSDSATADIFIDSVGQGRTPALLKLKAGKHRIQLVATGYKDWLTEIEVKTGSITNVTGQLEK